MGSQQGRGSRKTFGLRAIFAAGLALAFAFAGWSQPPLEDAVRPERINELAARLDSLTDAGKSAVLDFFVEAANKPSDRLSDSYALQIALRNVGPKVAKLAETSGGALRLQALAALGQIRAAGDVAMPVWQAALAQNDRRTDRAVGAGMLAYLKRGPLLRESILKESRTPFMAVTAADLEAVAPLLARLQQSPSPEARLAVYDGMTGFFDVVENVDISAAANPEAFADYKRRLPQLPEKLKGFFAAAREALPNAPPAEARAILICLEQIAEVSVARDDFMETNQPHRPVGRLLYTDLEPQGKEAAAGLSKELQHTLPGIVGSLSAADAEVRLAATEALENLASVSALELPRMAKALQDPNPFVRWAMVRTLAKVGLAQLPARSTEPSAPAPAPEASKKELLAKVVDALTPRLADDDLGVRAVTALALSQFGPQAAPAATALGRLAHQPDAALQLAAVRALDAIGPAAKDGVSGLAAALKSQDERVREQAAGVLAKLGPPAQAARPALQAALNDTSAAVRLRAAEALVRIEAPSVKP